MDGQTILVCLAGLLAAAYLIRGAWRTWADRGCSNGCGSCGSDRDKNTRADLIPVKDLFGRVRQANGAGPRRDGESGRRDKSDSFSA